jgi:hypothetical protein
MPTLTYIFDPYCPNSAAAAPAIVGLWHAHRSRVTFATVHAGTATARLGLGELDAACAHGLEAAQQAAELRSARAVEYVRDFERRLEPFRDTAAVRLFRERCAGFFR